MEKDQTKGNRKFEHKNQWFIFNAVAIAAAAAAAAAVVSAIVYCSLFDETLKCGLTFSACVCVCVSVLMIGLILEMCDNLLCSLDGSVTQE